MPLKTRVSKRTRGASGQLYALEEQNGALPPLEVGDIVLVRHKKILMRSFLRRATQSYWDHAALVIFPKDPASGCSNDIVIEAIQYGLNSSLRRGTEIHRLDKYLANPKKFDVGIKRVPGLGQDMKARVRAFALMNVDTPYYPLSTTKFFLARLFKGLGKRLLLRQRYSCSSLVQKAFYEAADWDKRQAVIFKGLGYTPIEVQETTSPADIARSPNCGWLWNKK